MACPLTPVDIARCWCAAFVADRNLQAWAQVYFGSAFAVQLGADLRRPPDSGDAPCIIVFPDAANMGAQRSKSDCSLGIVAAIDDGAWQDADGYQEMRGLLRLSELAPLLEKTMRDALPRARVLLVDTEYDISRFSLLQLVMSLTVKESLPIGRR